MYATINQEANELQIMKTVCKLLGIHKIRTMSIRLQSDGFIERGSVVVLRRYTDVTDPEKNHMNKAGTRWIQRIGTDGLRWSQGQSRVGVLSRSSSSCRAQGFGINGLRQSQGQSRVGDRRRSSSSCRAQEFGTGEGLVWS